MIVIIISCSVPIITNESTSIFHALILFHGIPVLPSNKSTCQIDGHLDYCCVLPVMNSAAMNISRQASLQHTDFISWNHGRKAGSHASPFLSFRRGLCTACIAVVYFPPPPMRVSVPLHLLLPGPALVWTEETPHRVSTCPSLVAPVSFMTVYLFSSPTCHCLSNSNLLCTYDSTV